jgi:Ser/Thr protein kinase RdoA (MazF antagonist)
MSVPDLDLAARDVLRQFPIVSTTDRVLALGNRGGFSGAGLWRVEASSGRALCLRAWPRDFSRERLKWIHRLMQGARAAGLDFVPEVFSSAHHITSVEHSHRLWDLTTWMSGQADFHARPTSTRLHASCAALARLHNAWRNQTPQTGPCPAIMRRLAQAETWRALVKSGWKLPPRSADVDPVRPWAERAYLILERKIDGVPCALAPWTERVFALQPCLCDIWHDHVLFDGDVVAGIVDYAAIKVDHPTVDLARLLGSMIGDDAILRASALDAYGRIRPLNWDEREFVKVLDETGTILAMATWLKWVYHDGKYFEDRRAVAERLAKVVERVETWKA